MRQASLIKPAGLENKFRTYLLSSHSADQVSIELQDLRCPKHVIFGQLEGELHQILLCLGEPVGRKMRKERG